MKIRYMILSSALLLLFAALSAIFAFSADRSAARLDAAKSSVDEIFSAYAEAALAALAASLAGESGADPLISAALFERSLASLPIEASAKRCVYRELELLRKHLTGDTPEEYDASWIMQAARDGISSLYEHITRGSDSDEREADALIAPIFMPSGKAAALKLAQDMIGAPIKLREASSAADGGSYVFYCANAYVVINMYDLRCTEFMYRPTHIGAVRLRREDADRAARESLTDYIGASSASRAVLSRYDERGGIAYLKYELLSGSEARLGIDLSSGRLLMYSRSG